MSLLIALWYRLEEKWYTMTMNKSLIALFLSAAMLVGFGAPGSVWAQEQTKNDEARLCKVYYMESVVPRQRNGTCPPSSSANEAGQCIVVSEAHNVFTYIQRDDRSLDFGLSYWFASGAHCGIIGNAKYTGEGWRYESNMDAEDPRQRCALNIIPKDDYVLFQTDPQATCRMECGAQAQLDGVFMPYDAVESRNVEPQDLEPEVFYNTPCR